MLIACNRAFHAVLLYTLSKGEVLDGRVYVCHNIVIVVTFLEESGLCFIGHDEHIESRHNSNFPWYHETDWGI